ncbi:MAG TPA: hypothetical protein VI216_11940 [Candidatus Acidoferrales bacterium]
MPKWLYRITRKWIFRQATVRRSLSSCRKAGELKNGRGEFFAQDAIDGKTILIRYVWTKLTTNSPHFEQSFSDDGGKTWEVNWITDQTRVTDEADRTRLSLAR